MRRCSRCSRSPTSRRAPTSRPISCRSSSGRSRCWRRCAQNPQIEQQTLEELLAQIDAVNAQLLGAGGQGRRAPARQRVADGDQAAHGDPRRRLRVRPARVPLVAAPGRRARAATTCAAGSSRSRRSAPASAIVLKLLRDNGRASRHTAYRGVFQLMLTTTKVAQLLRLTRRAATCRACRRSAPTSTRSTSASSACRAWTAARCIDRDVEFELMFCNL